MKEGAELGSEAGLAAKEQGAADRSEAAKSQGRGLGPRQGRQRDRAKRNGQPGRRARRRGRLTARDLELLRWLGRVKLARAEQVSDRFSLARSKTYARLQALCAEGLVRLERRVPGQGVYLATRPGLALCGLPLAEARMSLVTLEHDLAVAGTCAQLERALADATCLTEREMRAELACDGKVAWRTNVRDTGKGRSGHHWPDLVVHRGRGGFIAVEVELTQKRADRTNAILAGYRSHSEGLNAVLYLSPDRRSSERLLRMADAALLGRGIPLFRSLALSDKPDLGAIFAELAAACRAEQEESERRQAAEQERRRVEEDRREAERRAREEQLERDAAWVREQREGEQRRLSHRFRRTVRGH